MPDVLKRVYKHLTTTARFFKQVTVNSMSCDQWTDRQTGLTKLDNLNRAIKTAMCNIDVYLTTVDKPMPDSEVPTHAQTFDKCEPDVVGLASCTQDADGTRHQVDYVLARDMKKTAGQLKTQLLWSANVVQQASSATVATRSLDSNSTK